jgi:enoyl-CoA hydratase/carnithine racemase
LAVAQGGSVRDSLGRSLEDQLDEERETIAASAEDPDASEGIAAFLEKRFPRYRSG